MSGKNQNNNESWQARVDAMESTPCVAPLNKSAAWEKLHRRLEPGKRSRRLAWYYAAAAALLTFFLYQEWPAGRPGIVIENQPDNAKPASFPPALSSTEGRELKKHGEEIDVKQEQTTLKAKKPQIVGTVKPAPKGETEQDVELTKETLQEPGNDESGMLVQKLNPAKTDSNEQAPAQSNQNAHDVANANAPTSAPVARKMRVVHINEIDQAARQEHMARERYRHAPWRGEHVEISRQSLSAYSGFQIRILTSN